VSLDPAPERVLFPSRELGRVRCPRRNRLSSNAHDEIVRLDADAFARPDNQPIGRTTRQRHSGRRTPDPTALGWPTLDKRAGHCVASL
jgi:hypothetical protein